MFRFSGHDTFHCKEQWLLKGLELIDSQEDKSFSVFRHDSVIPKLGVGKNMVRAIQHWLRAFGAYDEDSGEISDIAKILLTDKKLDPYLENEGTLWLLQYYLCSSEYASIFSLIFRDYYQEKASLEFTNSQVIKFLHRKISESGQRSTTDKTLSSDFKVFIKTYVTSKKSEKSIEDDFNAPLIPLNLIIATGRKNHLNEDIYRINRATHSSISPEIFAHCLIHEFGEEFAIDLDQIQQSLSCYLCLSTDGLERLISELCEKYNRFVFKDDAGIKQLQLKNTNINLKSQLLDTYYEEAL